MLNYIRAELYRNFHRMYFWVFTGALAGFSLFITVVSKLNNASGMNMTAMLELTIALLAFPIFFAIPMIDISTSEENKNQTLRNVISFGMPRNVIVIAKVIVATLLCLVSAVIVLATLYGSAAVLFGVGPDFALKAPDYISRILSALPLWIGAIAVGTFMTIVINNNNLFVFVYAGTFLMMPRIISLLSWLIWDKLSNIKSILITTGIDKLAAPVVTSQDKLNAVVMGIAYIIVFSVLSMIYFNKKEVK